MATNWKICHFEVSSTLILYNNESFLNRIVMCDKWILYGNTEWLAQWLVQEEASKHFPKPNLHQKKKKKGGGLGHSHCLVVYCWTDPVQLYEFQWNQCNWEVCSANWWDVPKITIPAATISQQKGPSSSLQICPTVHHTTNTWKVEWTGLRSFASFATFTWLISNWLPLI